MKSRNIIESFNNAIKGIVHGFRTERNIKIHFIIALLVLIAAILANLSKIEVMLLFIVIAVVIAAELFNTALERIIDMIHPDYHPLAEAAKNMAAGAVLVTAVGSLMVGYIIFYNRLNSFSLALVRRLRNAPIHVTVISLAIIVIIVIMLKSFNFKGNFLRGGMPSGHSALAFSLFTSIALLSKNALVATLAMFMALMVIHSRYEAGIHTLAEIIIGAFLGMLLTVIVFELFHIVA
ncbi:diacylglycerol kinase (ATP) [Caldicoprobacter guelmensis]|uniref:diacylglycerol kinase n=1 Tax=Caldicoprobacter guelmensis TaxID=1170224 RepID=UPI00195AA710|nr:diacylglycerol kinase [Caldicoprobacter guelmensis]MBM7581833.1 diacylglycerol kinase (ATP) [Caldicoprobacter guelmensis]